MLMALKAHGEMSEHELSQLKVSAKEPHTSLLCVLCFVCEFNSKWANGSPPVKTLVIGINVLDRGIKYFEN